MSDPRTVAAVQAHHLVVVKHIRAVRAARLAIARRLQIARAVRLAQARRLRIEHTANALGQYLEAGATLTHTAPNAELEKARQTARAVKLRRDQVIRHVAAARTARHVTAEHARKVGLARQATRKLARITLKGSSIGG